MNGLQFKSIDTNDLPRNARLGTLRDFLAQELMGIDVQPQRNDGFYVSVHALSLPGILIAHGRSDCLSCARRQERLGHRLRLAARDRLIGGLLQRALRALVGRVIRARGAPCEKHRNQQ